VYASQPLSPLATQHSLPSGRYSLLGPDFHRLDRTSFAWRTHSGHLAERHGARHVNHTEPRGERCGWFACSNDESQFAVAKAVMTNIDCAGGIEVFRWLSSD